MKLNRKMRPLYALADQNNKLVALTPMPELFPTFRAVLVDLEQEEAEWILNDIGHLLTCASRAIEDHAELFYQDDVARKEEVAE